MFGRDPRLPIDLFWDVTTADDVDNVQRKDQEEVPHEGEEREGVEEANFSDVWLQEEELLHECFASLLEEHASDVSAAAVTAPTPETTPHTLTTLDS
ncbi:hypothetical protein HK102_000818 [Quaeritorhiza haematococci]|nr:hypothetical protein HK102_000818 [Quaeritorhiza haematococci]